MKNNLLTSEILARARAANNPQKPVDLPIHGSGSPDHGWTIRVTKSSTHYEKTVAATDDSEIQHELTEFWRKLAVEVGISCAGKRWNVLCVEATVDCGSIGGSAFNMIDTNAKTIDIRNMPCRVNVGLSIPHWQSVWDELEQLDQDESQWEEAAAALESSIYDHIEYGAVQEPARSALNELRKTARFDIWMQPHDSPEDGRFIALSSKS